MLPFIVMSFWRQLLPTAVITLLLSGIFAVQALRLLPFRDAAVREAAQKSVTQLHEKGVWLLNLDFLGVSGGEDRICLNWRHAYRFRTHTAAPELFSTCS